MVCSKILFVASQHRIEMELILKYSPFKTEEEFFEQFKKIVDHGKLLLFWFKNYMYEL